jgi:hypothetical protein
MAFLDNSGDIILDAVLTDEGRRRMALGKFSIDKFALADDEVDYSLYTPVTASGWQDRRILKLPTFEAFTNNVSSLSSKLLTYTDPSHLYLPVIKLNNVLPGAATVDDGAGPQDGYYVAMNATTVTHIKTTLKYQSATSNGYRYATDGADSVESQLVFDQGLDTTNLALGLLTNENSSRQNLFEKSYLVQCDNRLLQLAPPHGGAQAAPNFVDDDNIATYHFGLGSDPQYFAQQAGGLGGKAVPAFDITTPPNAAPQVLNTVIGSGLQGQIGSRLIICLRSTLGSRQGLGVWNDLGSSESITVNGTPTTFSVINTTVKIQGFTTGYQTTVPLKLLKYTS